MMLFFFFYGWEVVREKVGWINFFCPFFVWFSYSFCAVIWQFWSGKWMREKCIGSWVLAEVAGTGIKKGWPCGLASLGIMVLVL